MTRSQEEKLIEFALRVLAIIHNESTVATSNDSAWYLNKIECADWKLIDGDGHPLPWVEEAIKELKPSGKNRP